MGGRHCTLFTVHHSYRTESYSQFRIDHGCRIGGRLAALERWPLSHLFNTIFLSVWGGGGEGGDIFDRWLLRQAWLYFSRMVVICPAIGSKSQPPDGYASSTLKPQTVASMCALQATQSLQSLLGYSLLYKVRHLIMACEVNVCCM